MWQTIIATNLWGCNGFDWNGTYIIIQVVGERKTQNLN